MNTTVAPRDYEFTADWFSPHIPVFEHAFSKINPTHVLEIGCFEGRSTTWLIENLSKSQPVSLYCVDNWVGGNGLEADQIEGIEDRFRKNVEVAQEKRQVDIDIWICKGPSHEQLVSLLANGKKNFFDFIYVDGSHVAPDVLRDLVLAFDLCKVGGVMALDDYLWSKEGPGKQDLLNMPKIAVDSFTNIYQRKLNIWSMPLYQLYFQKISD